ncbi:DUF1794 domain-containing protein [Aliikangiella marina]|uniref:DUF1794 domain-containing protein n=1 Tax=Aliikangiella marina TaxID=1712262 RepID=A0A545T503_9GAMM|nr:heme-binding beta-barrel domain-containing protein [Aliikangiella marina]TQV72296.1 DUF1794 domain-containing protein [Aliikangiella marina]
MEIKLRRNLGDFGPFTGLIGRWYGETGKDVSPEEDGSTELNDYQETLTFEAIEDVDNAEEQELVVVRYEQVVIRIRDGKMIHNESGYYSWDAKQSLLMKSFSIPRGVSVVAGGKVVNSSDDILFSVSASNQSQDWRIAESPFMQQKAKTLSYDFILRLSGDTLSYSQQILLDIYGNEFQHSDENQLKRVS